MSVSHDRCEAKRDWFQVWFVRGIVVTAVIAIGWIGAAAYIANRAELNLIAFSEASLAICGFIEKTDGKWPRSWDDLVDIEIPYRGKPDVKRIKHLVEIDFNADPEVLMKQSPEEFVAIRQIDKDYRYPSVVLRRCERVILTLRGVREASRPPEPQSGGSK